MIERRQSVQAKEDVGDPRQRLGMLFNFHEVSEEPSGNGDEISIADSFIYVLTGEPGLVQLGVSRDPNAVLAEKRLVSSFPVNLAYLCVVAGSLQNAYNLEGNVHAILDGHRPPAEWLAVAFDEVVAAINTTSQRHRINIAEIRHSDIGRVRRLSAERKTASARSAASKRRLHLCICVAALSVFAISLSIALVA
ncbi:hypothetical protein ACXIUS_12525 [Bosea thiooxidans]